MKAFKITVGLLLALTVILVVNNQIRVYLDRQERARLEQLEREGRQRLFAELTPVALKTCQLERFGEPNDGGYLMCGNLLGDAKVAYSYGISGYDQWGCDISTRLKVPVHQYDCFETTRPVCATGVTVFHEECVGDSRRTLEGRPFDTITGQIVKNGDAGKNIVIKIDVEGAEWDSFAATPDAVFELVDQMAVEFHEVNDPAFLEVVQRLKRFFHVAHLHFNNFSCSGQSLAPFAGWAYEVLFVNKRLDTVDTERAVVSPHPLDAPNTLVYPDCQNPGPISPKTN